MPVSPCRSGLPLPAAAIRIGRNYDTEGQRGEDRVGKGDGRVRTGLIRGVVIRITARRRDRSNDARLLGIVEWRLP